MPSTVSFIFSRNWPWLYGSKLTRAVCFLCMAVTVLILNSSIKLYIYFFVYPSIDKCKAYTKHMFHSWTEHNDCDICAWSLSIRFGCRYLRTGELVLNIWIGYTTIQGKCTVYEGHGRQYFSREWTRHLIYLSFMTIFIQTLCGRVRPMFLCIPNHMFICQFVTLALLNRATRTLTGLAC